ncbi:MAG: hypothetical protein ACKVU4_02155, partial [Phycisphaerales bacterium]
MSRPSISIAVGISLLTAGAPVVLAQEWTWASLHPAGWAESRVRAVGGGRRAGYTREFVGGPGRAALWSGSASSWIDVHPKGAAFSHIFGSDG